MRIEQLEEFLIWANSKTVEEAAAKVHISQSAMSKHLLALETEIGAQLINRERKNHLTEAGLCLYNGLAEILPKLESVIEHCKNIDQKQYAHISVWDPFVFSGAMSIFERIMHNFEDTYEDNVRFELKNEAYATPLEAVCDGFVDVAIEYAPLGSDLNPGRDDIKLFPLLDEPIIIWCNKEHPLARKEEVHVTDLAGIPIMCSMRQAHPLQSSIVELCKGHGFNPIFHRFDPTSAASFFYGEPKNCVYLVTQGMQGDNRFKARKEMVVRKLAEPSFAVSSFVVLRKNESNRALGDFSEYLACNTKH